MSSPRYPSLIPFVLLGMLVVPAARGQRDTTVAPRVGNLAVPLPPEWVQDRDDLAAATAGATVEELPGGFAVLVPRAYQPTPSRDRRFKGVYPRAIWVYAPKPGPRGLTALAQTVVVHHHPEDAAWARRAARLCARLLRLHKQRFGRDAEFPRQVSRVDVWLSRDSAAGTSGHGPVGGKAVGTDVYVFDTGAPRSRIEWVRTLAHEWGHLTLSVPAAEGFRAPEFSASGFLGERLFLKWLREEQAGGKNAPLDDGTDSAGLDLYHQRQVAPLIARFQVLGPEAPVMSGTDVAAMDLYIGAVLAADSALGSETAGRGLFSVLGKRPRDFVEALADAIRSSASLGVRLPAWVPFAPATYRIAPSDPPAGGSVVFGDRPPLALQKKRGSMLQVRRSGWQWVRSPGGVRAIVVHRDGSAQAPRP